MAVQDQLPLKVKPKFLDMVWYSVSLFREGMIATLGGRNIWWSQSQGAADVVQSIFRNNADHSQ